MLKMTKKYYNKNNTLKLAKQGVKNIHEK